MVRESYQLFRLRSAARVLGELANEFVFVGGGITSLLVTDPAAREPRPTKDVDVILSVATLGEYYRIQERLQERGFAQQLGADEPLCRWFHTDLVLDVMPDDAKLLGYTNRWYTESYTTAESHDLSDGYVIKVVTPACFIATKLEAFDGRGGGDFLSHDIEDIVMILDGRDTIVEDVKRASESLQEYLRSRFDELASSEDFLAALPGHLQGDEVSQARAAIIFERIMELAK